MTSLNTLLNGSSVELPTFPAVAFKIIQLCKDDNYSLKELSENISSDPALAAKTLTVANSSYYSAMPGSSIDSVEQAISLLGSETIRNIAVSSVLAGKLRNEKLSFFDFDGFWERSITAAVAGETITKHLGKRSDHVFIMALLMNVGAVVMAICKPDIYKQLLEERKTTKLHTMILENRLFSVNHQEIGGDMLRKWGLPENICVPISFHHDPKSCPPEFLFYFDILQFSNFASKVDLIEMNEPMFNRLYGFIFDKFEMEKEETKTMLSEIIEKRETMLASFKA